MCSNLIQNRKVDIGPKPFNWDESDELRKKNAILEKRLRELELLDESIQPSKSDEMAKEIVESGIKVVGHRYEIPIPLKPEVVKNLTNNYDYALKRTKAMNSSASRNPELKLTLLNTFQELIDERWIEPADEEILTTPLNPVWYLPFFVTKQGKPRVVYDGAATVGGTSLNQCVLAGTNLLNNLVEVLTRFRLGKYAGMADLSRCFFQVAMPEEQRDFFRVIWFKNNNLDYGEPQVFRFTRHVWGINSSPYVALAAIKQLISDNPTRACERTLNAINENRYMDDVLFACDSLSDLETVSRESIALFQSRGFRLRKWITNSCAQSILSEIPKGDLAASISEITIGSQPMPDSKALGVIWDVENDKFKISFDKNFVVLTRRQMASQLASNFDPLGMASPCLLQGKLILQKVATTNLGWDDKLPDDTVSEWNSWLGSLVALSGVSIERYCFANSVIPGEDDRVTYQLHGFCDASNNAFSCVIYLRRVVNGRASLSFIFGKSRFVLKHQSNWVISRKELEAAKICSELMLLAQRSLSNLECAVRFWTDSQVVLKWITNPDLHLVKFVKRRVDKILLVSSPDTWGYICTSLNPADVGTREKSFNSPDSLNLWFGGPEFLLQESEDLQPFSSTSAVRQISVTRHLHSDNSEDPIFKLMDVAHDLYTLKKRLAYLITFKNFIIAKSKRVNFQKPTFDTTYLDRSLMYGIKYVQLQSFGAAINLLKRGSSDEFEQILKKLSATASNSEEFKKIYELKTLRNLRPCLDNEVMLRVEGRLDNAELPIDTRHPFILPSRHALTRLIVLDEHTKAGHAGPYYTLMLTRQRYWIIFGNGSVKHYIANCGKCALEKAKPLRQLMADLPSFRVTVANKPFQNTGIDYLGPILYRSNRSECKAWGLLFTCLSTRCLHVEIVTGLDLNNFLLAFTRFINLRGSVDTIYSDNGSTFCAAAEALPKLLDSSEFVNSVRKRGINWIRIPPYAPSQGGSWEIMVKLFKTTLRRIIGHARRIPTLIELQTFVSDAVRIVNDRPLTTPSDQPNDLLPITPSCFLGQKLAPYTPLGTFHDKGDLRRDCL